MSVLRLRAARCTAAVFLMLAGAALRAQDVATPKPVLTPAQIEEFLLNAEIRTTRAIGRGVTGAQRVTMTDGTLTHDAQVQTIDDAQLVFQAGQATELNFKDSYRYNIAAYRISRMLGLTNVPPSVQRTVRAKSAAVTWWIDDVAMEEGARLKNKIEPPDQERLAMQIHVMRVFDELIQNVDRNAGNMLWTKDWTLWMIDHTRAFRLGKVVRRPVLLERCERNLFTQLKALSVDSVSEAVGNSLVKGEVEALIARRDAIVAHFNARMATLGESSVLYVMR